MPQLFPSTSRKRFRHIVALIACTFVLVLGGLYYNSFRHWEYTPAQPVEFSHKTHIQLGLDCTFCHTSVSHSPKAGIPDSQSCMACHRHIMPDSPLLEPLRKSSDRNHPEYTGSPIAWVMVNTWAGHSKFSHQSHVSRGVGCTDCHGNIAEMDTVSTPQNRGMRWCVDCHRNPATALRPLQAVALPDYSPDHFLNQYPNAVKGGKQSAETLGETLRKRWKIKPPVNDCSACHY